MAWNKYYIIVTGQQQAQQEDILRKLGLDDFVAEEQVELIASNKPKTLFVGEYNGNLLLVHPALPFAFFSAEPTETEERFIQAFPESQIAVLIENSTVHLFGYAIIDKGKRIRMKDGADLEVFNDFGELLPEEKAILSGSILDEEDLEEMREDMTEEEVKAAVLFEASWRVPNLLSKRYFGQTLDEMDVSSVLLTKYRSS